MSRLFFALWPSPACQKTIEAIGAGTSAGRAQGKSRAIPAASLHLTLQFLGPTTPEQRLNVENAASRISADPFTLILDTVGHWPRPKILWSAPSTSPTALDDLMEMLGRRLDDCGFAPETRPFSPHVTLARNVQRRVRTTGHTPIEWRVEDFVLVESNTLSGGAVYRVQKRWPLVSNPVSNGPADL